PRRLAHQQKECLESRKLSHQAEAQAFEILENAAQKADAGFRGAWAHSASKELVVSSLDFPPNDGHQLASFNCSRVEYARRNHPDLGSHREVAGPAEEASLTSTVLSLVWTS